MELYSCSCWPPHSLRGFRIISNLIYIRKVHNFILVLRNSIGRFRFFIVAARCLTTKAATWEAVEIHQLHSVISMSQQFKWFSRRISLKEIPWFTSKFIYFLKPSSVTIARAWWYSTDTVSTFISASYTYTFHLSPAVSKTLVALALLLWTICRLIYLLMSKSVFILTSWRSPKDQWCNENEKQFEIHL